MTFYYSRWKHKNGTVYEAFMDMIILDARDPRWDGMTDSAPELKRMLLKPDGLCV